MSDIDLHKYRTGGSRVFSGREYGSDLRNRLDLEAEDNSAESVNVIIPEETLSLNSSFFLGLFGPSVRKLGEVGFRTKYIFVCPTRIRPNIETGIRRALLTTNPIDAAVA